MRPSHILAETAKKTSSIVRITATIFPISFGRGYSERLRKKIIALHLLTDLLRDMSLGDNATKKLYLRFGQQGIETCIGVGQFFYLRRFPYFDHFSIAQSGDKQLPC